MKAERKVLAIDNYDSFVHILADEFRRRCCRVDVFRSHWPAEEALGYITDVRPDLLRIRFCQQPIQAAPQEKQGLGGIT